MARRMVGRDTPSRSASSTSFSSLLPTGTPLGQAYAHANVPEPSASAAPPLVPVEAPPPRQVVQRFRREPETAFSTPLSD